MTEKESDTLLLRLLKEKEQYKYECHPNPNYMVFDGDEFDDDSTTSEGVVNGVEGGECDASTFVPDPKR